MRDRSRRTRCLTLDIRADQGVYGRDYVCFVPRPPDATALSGFCPKLGRTSEFRAVSRTVSALHVSLGAADSPGLLCRSSNKCAAAPGSWVVDRLLRQSRTL